MIRTHRVVQWMNYLRSNPGQVSDVLECFWDSQLRSKEWLLDNLLAVDPFLGTNVYIFGGWYGILAQLLIDRFPYFNLVTSVDINPKCAEAGRQIANDGRIRFETYDMAAYTYPYHPHFVINTSTEHVDQDTFDMWFDKIPSETTIALQGNNYFDHPEHIRSAHTLTDFKLMNNVQDLDVKMSGQLRCGHFDRYMMIGVKRGDIV